MNVNATAIPAVQKASERVIARLVVDDMPGMGVQQIVQGPRLEPATTWASITDAEAAVRQLTQSDDVPAAGIFRHAGRFEAYELRTQTPGYPQEPYTAYYNDNVARTRAGRSLVTIVDGNDTPSIMSAKDFRRYERWAGDE